MVHTPFPSHTHKRQPAPWAGPEGGGYQARLASVRLPRTFLKKPQREPISSKRGAALFRPVRDSGVRYLGGNRRTRPLGL